ncbi:MAG: TetR/AcrR family transcriptional regulator [Erythrobacter sp.]|nr:TetR/AcrR family transcriptional regulator [Erythrobacter sp.]MDZ4271695.1 TetR/AcrR family transcriptional regulator [Erythrobacter sp.]
MPWEKNFDVETTLTRAMQVFWARGYEATSMQDLVTATGVNRASIYATYGDKRALFLSALKKYDVDIRRRMFEQLGASQPPAEAITTVFDRFIDQTKVPQGNWGCFIVNTALELAAHDSEIAELVNAAQDDIEAFFLAMIRKGQQDGAFAADRDAGELAHQTLAAMLGMLVMIRSRPDADTLTTIRDGVLKSLI